jgi:glycerophosphoryl diester phosphodiesterase
VSVFEIVAHRGLHDEVPENTIAAFERAVELGADAVELDVRLTSDGVPVVYHYCYLDEVASLVGPIFDYTLERVREAILQSASGESERAGIPTLRQVLEVIGGRIGLEIEIKGPEPESSGFVAGILADFAHLWNTMEVTSYEPALLRDIKRLCPGLAVDLLHPRSESWMRLDVVAYSAAHRARLAGARAVHLHPTQLSPDVVAAVRSLGIEVHAWDVNDEDSLTLAFDLSIPKICTDDLTRALDFRTRSVIAR